MDKKNIKWIKAHPVTGAFLGSLVIFLLGGLGWFAKALFFSPAGHLPIAVTQENTTGPGTNLSRTGDIHIQGMTPEERESYIHMLKRQRQTRITE
ncbi:MAG: hypothetical protein VCD00_13910 [Candidatus Hydrogenedentota bacterium]